MSDTLPRRRFLESAAAAAGALTLGACSDALQRVVAPPSSVASLGADELPIHPARSGIEHIVLVMMENRSFDHFLGWHDDADGRQEGLRYRDAAGTVFETYELAPDFQGCGKSDPDHSYAGGRVEYDDGRCDGWLRAGQNDRYSIGYYRKRDLPFLGRAATHWTVCDRYFAAALAETFPNRFFQHAGQTDRLTGDLTLATLPTIWDRLAAAGLAGRYYFSDLPFLALWGQTYLSISRPIAEFFADCAAGTLPHVSFVEPTFLGEAQGIANDDHPHADIRAGEVFLNSIYEAVTRSPNWGNTVLIINYDEWGGFFDHVPPPLAPLTTLDPGLGNDGRRGFRVPALIISPFARRQHVARRLYDHTSVLRMIEWRWDLNPLTVRDRTAGNLARELDFDSRSLRAPVFPVAPFTPSPCPVPRGTVADRANKWAPLRDVARARGWAV